MKTHGRHLLVDYWGCAQDQLADIAYLENLMRTAAEAIQATVVQSTFHAFAPHGVSGVVLIEESHLSIHTWPEAGYAAVDCYTCGGGDLQQALDVIRSELGAEHFEMRLVERGLSEQGSSMRF